MKTGAIIAIAAVLIVAAFAGGWYLAQPDGGGAAESAKQGPGEGSGPTAEDRAAMENMSPEERQAFVQEQFGAEAPGRGGEAGAPGGGMRAITIEGEILDIDAETVTVALSDGGSQTLYLDEATTIAFAQEVDGEVTAGRMVQVVGEPEADGVASATLLVVVQ